MEKFQRCYKYLFFLWLHNSLYFITNSSSWFIYLFFCFCCIFDFIRIYLWFWFSMNRLNFNCAWNGSLNLFLNWNQINVVSSFLHDNNNNSHYSFFFAMKTISLAPLQGIDIAVELLNQKFIFKNANMWMNYIVAVIAD